MEVGDVCFSWLVLFVPITAVMENSTEEQREELKEEVEPTEEKTHSNLKGTHQTSFNMWLNLQPGADVITSPDTVQLSTE